MNPSQHHRGISLVEIIVLSAVVILLALVLTPRVLGPPHHPHDRVVAMNNARQLMLGLNDFSFEYGSFPDRTTAREVIARTKTTLDLSGDTANDYFRQLIAAGIIKSEDPFFATSANCEPRPDNRIGGSESLKPGEVGFAYLMDGESALPAQSPDLIIAVTPVANAQGDFETGPYDRKAVAINVDSSVRLLDIDPKTRKARLGNGRYLLDTGPGTPWGTTIHPVIKPPAMAR